MPRLFGTDGVRGVAGVDLTVELALRLAAAAARELVPPAAATADVRPLAVVGRDTRPSGEMLESAVVAGLLAAGVDVELLGVTPTPAVAHAVAATGAALGVVISASHNPMADNGIKFFGPGGRKLSDEVEDRIAARLSAAPEPDDRDGAVTGAAVGRCRAGLADERAAAYVEHLLGSVPHPLDGLRVVVDCANGAAGVVGPAAYRAAGADVVVINDETDGYRINDGCGATHLEPLVEAVRAHGATAGLAHDGDADRCLAVDERGEPVDGDQLLALLAVARHERGDLPGNAIAATVMSNLGLHRALAARGIAVVQTPVGDRYVLDRMLADGLALGGEQSGHVILADHATTGDGILTGLHVLARIAETQRPLSELAGVVERLPQVLVNVRVDDRAAALAALEPAVAAVEAELDGDGRVLVRPSGTEPLVRIMVEAPTTEQAQAVADRLAALVVPTPASAPEPAPVSAPAPLPADHGEASVKTDI